MPKPMRTKPVSGAQVRAYAGKAEEYADTAASELEAGCYIAATSLAIHAGINAADAVCGARLGERAAGEDHDQVLTLLRQAGPTARRSRRNSDGYFRSRRKPSTSPMTSPQELRPRPSNVLKDASLLLALSRPVPRSPITASGAGAQRARTCRRPLRSGPSRPSTARRTARSLSASPGSPLC
jgi:hypothetical protein